MCYSSALITDGGWGAFDTGLGSGQSHSATCLCLYLQVTSCMHQTKSGALRVFLDMLEKGCWEMHTEGKACLGINVLLIYSTNILILMYRVTRGDHKRPIEGSKKKPVNTTECLAFPLRDWRKAKQKHFADFVINTIVETTVSPIEACFKNPFSAGGWCSCVKKKKSGLNAWLNRFLWETLLKA